jgi:hypothetical protein
MRIIFDKDVENYLKEPVDVLYKKEHFCLKSSTCDYIGWIIDSIEHNLPTIPYKVVPLSSNVTVKLCHMLSKKMPINNSTFFYHEDNIFLFDI